MQEKRQHKPSYTTCVKLHSGTARQHGKQVTTPVWQLDTGTGENDHSWLETVSTSSGSPPSAPAASTGSRVAEMSWLWRFLLANLEKTPVICCAERNSSYWKSLLPFESLATRIALDTVAPSSFCPVLSPFINFSCRYWRCLSEKRPPAWVVFSAQPVSIGVDDRLQEADVNTGIPSRRSSTFLTNISLAVSMLVRLTSWCLPWSRWRWRSLWLENVLSHPSSGQLKRPVTRACVVLAPVVGGGGTTSLGTLLSSRMVSLGFRKVFHKEDQARNLPDPNSYAFHIWTPWSEKRKLFSNEMSLSFTLVFSLVTEHRYTWHVGNMALSMAAFNSVPAIRKSMEYSCWENCFGTLGDSIQTSIRPRNYVPVVTLCPSSRCRLMWHFRTAGRRSHGPLPFRGAEKSSRWTWMPVCWRALQAASVEAEW